MVSAQRTLSVLLTLSLMLSLGVLAPPASRTAHAAEISVSSGESIQDAIDAAAPGDTIIVHPGTYDGDLSIDKSLTLVSSDGAAATIIDCVATAGITIALTDEESVVFGGAGAGFTVNSASDGVDVTVEYWSSLTIEGNTFTFCDYAIDVNAVRYFSSLAVRGNTIDNTNASSGIYFYSDSLLAHSSVDIVDNTISGCGGNGVCGAEVKYDSHVVVEGNTFESTGNTGVAFTSVCDRSSLDILDNEILDNEYTGIDVDSWSELSEGTIRGNTITGNPDYGIYVEVGVDDGARLTIEDNTITGNPGYGCYIYEVKNGSYLAVVDNKLDDNGEDGLYVETLYYSCEGVIRGNTVTGNGSDGVYLYNDVACSSRLTVEGNTMSGNAGYGFYMSGVDDRSRIDVLDNEINGNRVGVYLNDIENSSEGRFESNTISGNGLSSSDDGFFIEYVDSDSRLTLQQNAIEGNGAYGLYIGEYVYAGAVISLVDNDITGNPVGGVYISEVCDGCECLFEDNTITGNGGSGVFIDDLYDYPEYGCRFTVQDNTISGNDVYGLYLASLSYGAYLGVLENTIKDNDSDGVPDSAFLDIGLPTFTNAAGVSVQPRAAFLVVDLDGLRLAGAELLVRE